MEEHGRKGRNIASFSFRQLPAAPADVSGHPRHVWTEDGKWKLVKYAEKKIKWPKCQKPGRVGGILHPSDSTSFRQLPRTSVDVRAMCGRKAEDGRCEITAKNREKWLKWQKPRRGGVDIASVSFRGRLWTSAAFLDRRWKMEACEL